MNDLYCGTSPLVISIPYKNHYKSAEGLGLWCLMPLSALSVEETGVNRENHRPLYPQKWAHLKHNYIVYIKSTIKKRVQYTI